jgi:hypothetical protein
MAKIQIVRTRIAFPALHKPDEKFNKYGATLILPPKHKAVAEIQKAMQELAKDKWGTKWEAEYKKLEASEKLALRSGDSKDKYDGFAGNYILSTGNNVKPRIEDSDGSELPESTGKPYSGCYVHASVEIWVQDNSYGKRINATLRAVRFDKDGEPFAGGAPAGPDEFADLTVDDDEFADL